MGRFVLIITLLVHVIALPDRATSSPTTETVRIGSEALMELPNVALWNGIVNFRPGNGDHVTLNPPRFSWSYTPNPADADKDKSVREFQFQAAYDPQFTNLAVDVRTASNLFNTIAPFKERTVYWKVGYIEADQSRPSIWSETRRFTISEDAVRWDRSMLTSKDYLEQHGIHPHILFNSQSRRPLKDYLDKSGGKAWTVAQSKADAAIKSSWWQKEDPGNDIKDGGRAGAIANIAFVWQVTRDHKYLDAKPQEALVRLARHYLEIKGDRKDVITQLPGGGGEMIRALGFGYDWLYEVMTLEERQVVLRAIESNCQFMLNAFCWRSPKDSSLTNADPLGQYKGGFIVRRFSYAKIGTSHTINNFEHAMVAALAAYADSTAVRQFFDLGVNYMIGRTYPYGSDGGMNQGRNYSGTEGIWNKGPLSNAILYQIAFPEAKFNLNPFFRLQADWWSRVTPVGFTTGHEPWGDSGWGRYDAWRGNQFGRDLALFTGDGGALKHWREENSISRVRAQPDKFEELPIPFYFQSPVEKVNLPLAKAFLEEGWVTGATYPSNTKACFADGVGFVFQARPRGSECGHSHFSDLSFEIWAYGSTITDAGAMMTPYAKVPACHYSLLVDGLGTCQPLQGPVEPFYSRILAFKETPEYTYTAGDATRAYPHHDFQPAGWLLPREFSRLHSGGALAYVKKVNRHILFVRKKYFVMFDDLETDKPAKFTWLYHVLENTLQLDPKNASFGYTSGNVRTQVVHITKPEDLDVVDLTGEEVRSNPLTGEQYDARRDPHRRAHAIWVTNKAPATKFHFMTVIYPIKPGTAAPKITRLDDYTAEIVNGTERDVISFDPQTAYPATLLVDVPAISGGARYASSR